MTTHAGEIEAKSRFTFGENWSRFVPLINDYRIERAEASLKSMLDRADLTGLSFLDVGSGSGLFSLAARRLGARVRSLDYDPQSVSCTQELKRRYFSDDTDWIVDEGSALDLEYLKKMGEWDIVYSWGVLHHTGEMWQACANIAGLVKSGGQLFIAIYNDQGRSSRRWLAVKKAYCRSPFPIKWMILVACSVRLRGPSFLRDALRGDPLRSWRESDRSFMRGMSVWRDIVDWVGGLPFEVAKPEEIFVFFRDRGFELEQMVTCAGGHGCNEFVFRRAHSA
jgi:2-polyprenyl-6-hydroxyphenyl methylase/3-demethylubiquinone-9 3-methyltransferase